MFKLLQSIFEQAPEPSRGYDEELIERAVERVVDGTDPRLRAVSGYSKKLRPAVIKVIDYSMELVDALPPPLTLAKKQFNQDQRMSAFFVSPEHINEFLTQSLVLQDYREKRKGLDPEYVHALLSVTRNERRVLGMELDGEIVRRDVAQISVSFSNHRLSCPMDEESGSRFETKKDVFDFFIKQALGNIIAIRDKQQKSINRQKILNEKLRTLEAASWGIDAVLSGESEKPVDVDQTEISINKMEAELEELEAPPLTLDHYLESIVETFDGVRDLLWKTSLSIKLNRMGIKIENEDLEAPINLDIDEYHSADGRTAIAVPVRIPFDQIPDKPDFLSQASRYL